MILIAQTTMITTVLLLEVHTQTIPMEQGEAHHTQGAYHLLTLAPLITTLIMMRRLLPIMHHLDDDHLWMVHLPLMGITLHHITRIPLAIRILLHTDVHQSRIPMQVPFV